LTEGILSYQVRKTGTGYDRLMSRTAWWNWEENILIATPMENPC
jgi:hypothetical protein